MGHKDKSLFLDASLKDRVFRKAGQVEATVLADLKVRGTWRTIRKGKVLRFEIEPFEEFEESWVEQLDKEVKRTAAALGFSQAETKI